MLIMEKGPLKDPRWDYYSLLILASFCTLQIIRWQLLPQSMDIYYHLLTAWGFIQANGFSGWDFWEYAPFGRVHIYPPAFHIILALFIKLGINKIILAKFFETATPLIFLIILWNFFKENFSGRMAFFVALFFGSSLSFYLSLLNHIPSTLAFIFGILACRQLFKLKWLKGSLFLALCFYTHIGIAWFFALAFIFYAIFNKEHRGRYFIAFVSAFVLSVPILLHQLEGLRYIRGLGLNLNERYLFQLKVGDYIFAICGLALIFKKEAKYRFLLSLFLASLVFVIYPFRFFSSEGFFPILILSAFFSDNLYERFNTKYFLIVISVFVLFVSPTVLLNNWTERPNRGAYKLKIGDSAFLGMLLERGQTIWFPKEYLPATDLIRNNSDADDIVYSTLNLSGVTLASLSGRATANALFPEIGPSRPFNPFLVSKIIVFIRQDSRKAVNRIISAYRLTTIGETKIFMIYKNPLCKYKMQRRHAQVPLRVLILIGVVLVALLWLKF